MRDRRIVTKIRGRDWYRGRDLQRRQKTSGKSRSGGRGRDYYGRDEL